LIQILKLVNGDTILTEVVGADDKILTINNPLELRTEPSLTSNRANMIANQWLPMMEKRNIIYLSQSHIVGTMPANEDMIDYYNHAIEVILFPEEARLREEQERAEYQKLLEGLREMAANTNGVLH